MASVDRQRLPFPGFEHLDANYVYCPNQFFDICLRHCSLNAVRLVGHVLFQTLGWLDRNGNPRCQNITVSYRDLIARAGISRGAIRPAIEEAIAARFVVRTRKGESKSEGRGSQQAQFALRWSDADAYGTNPKTFDGFFKGEGNRTPIPNAFFEHVLPQERLAVVKVVGTVLRHTVGYQNQFGGRRTDAPLPYSFMQEYADIRNRTTLNDAIRDAIDVGYVTCTRPGVFSSDAKSRRPAEYAVKWLVQADVANIGSKSVPASSDRFKKRTSIGSESVPADRFRIRTTRKTTGKTTDKQQGVPPVAAGNSEAYHLLVDVGFDSDTAAALAGSRGLVEIQQQIAWLPERNPTENELGMLRKAIEQNWEKPAAVKQSEKQQRLATKARKESQEQKIDDVEAIERKQERRRRRNAAMLAYRRMSDDERSDLEADTYNRLNSDFFRKQFKTNEEFHLHQCLDEIIRRETVAVST